MRLDGSILSLLLLVPPSIAGAETRADAKLLEACSDLAAKSRTELAPDACAKLATSGDARVQAAVAVHFLGVGDYAAAKQWFTRSAEKGDPNAQNGLGFMHQFGYGVRRDRKIANAYFLKSAKQGNADSQFWLGENLVLAKNYREGAYWTREAARNGSANAQFNLAMLHKDGHGVEKDVAFTYFWFTVAGMNGDGRSKELIEKMNAEMPKEVLEELARFVRGQLESCPNCLHRR